MNYDLVFAHPDGEETYIRVICENEDYLQTEIKKYISLHPNTTFCRSKRITCSGCLNDFPSQEAHMFPSGCLYDPEYF